MSALCPKKEESAPLARRLSVYAKSGVPALTAAAQLWIRTSISLTAGLVYPLVFIVFLRRGAIGYYLLWLAIKGCCHNTRLCGCLVYHYIVVIYRNV